MKRIHRKKELTELQQLKLENKNIRIENNQLKRENRKLKKTEHYHEVIRPFEDEEDRQIPLFEDKKQKCPECNKGELVHYNVVGRTWSECSQCDYRSKTVKIGLDTK